MKNLLFGLIATVLFASNGNAQKITQESVRLQLAQGMSDLTSTLKPAFDKTSNAEDFKKLITGSWYSNITKEGNDLLNMSYKLLSSKTSPEEILKNYNGKEMAAAALYVDNLFKKGIKSDGSELFGGTTGDYNPYVNEVTAKCRWYQLSCWIKEIFGEAAGTIINETIVTILSGLIGGIKIR
jgi:hypothetical protein